MYALVLCHALSTFTLCQTSQSTQCLHCLCPLNVNALPVCSPQARNVTAVTVHDIKVKGLSSVSLQLTHVLLTPPLGIQLADVRSVDLPMYGSVGVSAADVTLLPYVGRLELISSLDGGNANIQQAPGGFIVRGSVSSSPHPCRQRLVWQALWKSSGQHAGV